MNNIERIIKLEQERNLPDDELIHLIRTIEPAECEELYGRARRVREDMYGKDVYVRGLIEFSNICKNDCLYCGIRKSNKNADRYRLSADEIYTCTFRVRVLLLRRIKFIIYGAVELFYF